MRRQHYKKRKSFKAKRCRNTLPEVISRIVCNFHEEKNLLFLHGSIVSKLLSFEVKEDLNIRVAKQAGTVFRYCRRLRVFLQRLTMYIENLFFSCDFFACLLFITMLLFRSVVKLTKLSHKFLKLIFTNFCLEVQSISFKGRIILEIEFSVILKSFVVSRERQKAKRRFADYIFLQASVTCNLQGLVIVLHCDNLFSLHSATIS